MSWPINPRIVALGIIALTTAANAAAAERSALSNLLKAMNLSSYSSTLQPPEFSGVTAAGQKVSLAGLRGRVVLLNFWAAWCLECRSEMPMFERLHREFSLQGLAVVGINVREGPSTIRQYARELGLTFPLVMDPEGTINAAYGVIGLPTTFLLARDGRSVALAVGPRDWASKPASAVIQALLAEPTPVKGSR